MSERYEILERLGQGGSGAVYRAFDRQLQRPVAIKKLVAGGSGADNGTTTHGGPDTLRHEALALSALQHPNIVTVHDIGGDEEGPWVVMELLEGSTLEAVVKEAPLPLREFGMLVHDALNALAAAHARNILHRDLKPSNIMLVWLPTGELQFKLLDFGIAKFTTAPSVQTLDVGGTILGTVYYMAPEQFERLPLDARTDLYQLGCVLHHALTGHNPFTGSSAVEVMAAHLQHQVGPLAEWRPDLPPTVIAWVGSLMSRRMEDRPDGAVEALALFKQALAPSVGASLPPRPAVKRLVPMRAAVSVPAPAPRQSWGLAVVLGLVVVAAVAGSAVVFLGRDKGGPPAASSVANPVSAPLPPAAAIAPVSTASSGKTVPGPESLEHFRALLDQEAEVEGVVVSLGESKTGRTRYLNFSRRPGETISLAFRAAETGDLFPRERLEALKGTRVKARGRVTDFNGSLLLYVERMEDLVPLTSPMAVQR